MSELTIALPPDLERRLSEEAARRGQPVAEDARPVLEAGVPSGETDNTESAGVM